MPLDAGNLLHKRYLIESVVAHGGMGSVYRALDQNLNIQVAVKENLIETEDSSRQFHREATMLAGLRHPNLPRVTDHFIIPGQGEYLIMDFIEGSDLREIIETRSPLAYDEVVKIGLTICDALSYLHQRVPPIIHRDVKPSNIKITPAGHIYLVDFGLAKINIEGQTTTTGAKSLTPGYAPPEQYGSGTDARSDVYALGATLYAALSKNIPEDGIARMVGAAELTPLAKIRPDVPDYIIRAIEKSIEVKKEDRFQNIEAFKAALLNQTYQPPKTPSENDPGEIKKQPVFVAPTVQEPASNTIILTDKEHISISQTKRSAMIWVLPIAGILFVGLLLFFILSFNQPARQDSPTVVESTLSPQSEIAVTVTPSTVPPRQTPAITSVVETVTPLAALPVDASPQAVVTPLGGGSGQIAYTSEKSGKPQIWIMNSDGSDSKQISSLPDGACQPDWSPDGQKLILVSPCSGQKEVYNGSGLFTLNADGSGLMPLPSLPGGDYTPRWSPDGARIAFTSVRGGVANIYVMNLSDRSVVKISRNNLVEQNPVWSPDGKWLAIESTRLNQRQIWIVDPDNPANASEFSNIDSAAYTPDWSPDGKVIIFSQGSSLPWLAARQFEVKGAPEIRLSDQRPALQPRYSPDGFWIVFEVKGDNSADIYVMNNNGSQITRLTNNQAVNYDPVWRPLSR